MFTIFFLTLNKLVVKRGQFNIERCVRQGDPLSPSLFNCALEEAFKKLDRKRRGVPINGKYINNLKYADDMVLIAKNYRDLEGMAQELIIKCKEAGLSINSKKTKILGKGNQQNISGRGKIEVVREVEYLGQIILFENRMGRELSRRIKDGLTFGDLNLFLRVVWIWVRK